MLTKLRSTNIRDENFNQLKGKDFMMLLELVGPEVKMNAILVDKEKICGATDYADNQEFKAFL